MSTNGAIIILSLVIAVSLFTLGQWLNADVARTPNDNQACQRLGTC